MVSPLSVDLLKKIQRKLKDVEKLEFQSGPDSEGQPSNRVWVVLKAKAPEQAWSWENRERIRSLIVEELKKAGVTDWTYVRFRYANEEKPSAFISST
jgi:hypothetical protein